MIKIRSPIKYIGMSMQGSEILYNMERNIKPTKKQHTGNAAKVSYAHQGRRLTRTETVVATQLIVSVVASD